MLSYKRLTFLPPSIGTTLVFLPSKVERAFLRDVLSANYLLFRNKDLFQWDIRKNKKWNSRWKISTFFAIMKIFISNYAICIAIKDPTYLYFTKTSRVSRVEPFLMSAINYFYYFCNQFQNHNQHKKHFPELKIVSFH